MLEGYKSSQELATAATEADGAAMDDQNKYAESLAGKLQTLDNTWTAIKQNLGKNDFIKIIVGGLTKIAEGLEWITKSSGRTFAALTAGVVGYNKLKNSNAGRIKKVSNTTSTVYS